MSNFNYTSLYGEVLPEVPGCPSDIALNAIRNAAIEFCDLSLAWQADVDPITVFANTPSYDLDTPSTSAEVAKIIKAWFNTTELVPIDVDGLSAVYGDWSIQAGTPLYITQLPSVLSSVTLVPFPGTTSSGTLKIRVAYKPTRASTFFDGDVAAIYAEAIAHGAKARLMSIPGKPYTNPQSAAYCYGLYRDAISRARVRVSRGMMRSSLRVQFPRI